MTDNLRTLKDLKFNLKEKDKDIRELIEMIQEYFHKDLKQEARKWVKNSPYRREIAFVCAFKDFFNLTEDNLKGLRTLKDIEFADGDDIREKLKQEAIKMLNLENSDHLISWLDSSIDRKNLKGTTLGSQESREYPNFRVFTTTGDSSERNLRIRLIHQFIIHFFGITDEDLKGGYEK